jgi:trk system potassium uptake protein TrkA
VRVAVAGAGNVGQFIANDLAAAGHQVLLIEQDPAVVTRSAPGLSGGANGGSIEWRTADACEVSSLREARLDQVDVVVAATGDDEDNLVVSLLAKQEFAVPRVIARVNHPKNEWLFNEAWGVDVSVSTPHLILALTEEALSVGTLVRLLQLERGRARLVEVTLAPDSPVLGKAIQEVGAPRDSNFVAIVREDHVVVPRGDTVFEQGDEVLALVTPESEEEVEQLLTGKTPAGAGQPEDSSS